VYEGPYGTNLSSTGNPIVKTVKAIPRYVIKPLTYLFNCLTSAWIFTCVCTFAAALSWRQAWCVRADYRITSSSRAVIGWDASAGYARAARPV